MKTNIAIKVDINKAKPNKSGECQIYIFINATVNSQRMRKQIFTGYNVNPEYWDSTKGVIKNVQGSDIANLEISEMLIKLQKIKSTLELQNKECNPEILVSYFQNENHEVDKKDYFKFVQNELNNSSKDYSPTYYKDMLMNLDMLKSFTDGKLFFEDITPVFLNKYRYYLEHTKGNKTNSIYQKLTTIRKFVNEANRLGITNYYGFKDYKLATEEVEKDFLELEEIKKLHSFYDSNDCSERLRVTLHYFLLSCYTGLRLSDIKKVNKESIINNTIILKTQKTGSHVRIPLNNSALRLMNFELEGIKLFERTIKQSNSRISKDISDALEIVGVKKKLTFHSSRHSFAINSLVLGIPIEVVSKILGHTDLKTTQIYAKVVDSLTNREMEKWNNI